MYRTSSKVNAYQPENSKIVSCWWKICFNFTSLCKWKVPKLGSYVLNVAKSWSLNTTQEKQKKYCMAMFGDSINVFHENIIDFFASEGKTAFWTKLRQTKWRPKIPSLNWEKEKVKSHVSCDLAAKSYKRYVWHLNRDLVIVSLINFILIKKIIEIANEVLLKYLILTYQVINSWSHIP